MNTEMYNQNNQRINDIYSNNNIQSTINYNLNSNESLNCINNMQPSNYLPNNNGKNNNKTKKNIIIMIIVLVIIIIILSLISLLLNYSDNDSNNQHSQINGNKDENILENQDELNNNKDEQIIENEEQQNNNKDEQIMENEESTNSDNSYIENTNILKRSLGEISSFDNGISIKITNSIEYVPDEDGYYKPMFIKVEISNDSNRNFYQSSITHSIYAGYTENPVEFIREDFDYTTFDIVPMYLLGDELKTERCGCVLKKETYIDVAKQDGQGGFSDINYFVLKPGEQKTAYMLCYFREEIQNAKINTIYLFKDSKEFMYFMD